MLAVPSLSVEIVYWWGEIVFLLSQRQILTVNANSVSHSGLKLQRRALNLASIWKLSCRVVSIQVVS